MAGPKYSVVIPTLNGGATLALTLPAMLRIDRDDVEWVISDNRSDDNTKEVVTGLNDPRIKYFEAPERLHHSRHLEFAYLQARGEWQGHLGDDDILFPSRFELLDAVMKESDAQVIRGGNLRYHWPEYPVKEQANHIDACRFNGAIYEVPSKEFVANQINEVRIFGGGSWVVRRSVVEAVRRRCGYFVSPRNVEFFAMRAAGAASEKIALLGLPIWVLGRHSGSTGTQALYPKKEATGSDWDWKLEYPEPWPHCPFDYHGYVPISWDAALAVLAAFPEIRRYADVRPLLWLRRVQEDIGRMIRVGRLPPGSMELFSRGLARMPWRVRTQWRLRNRPRLRGLFGALVGFQESPPAPLPTSGVQDQKDTKAFFGWPRPLNGAELGIESIVDVPLWVEKTYPGFFQGRP